MLKRIAKGLTVASVLCGVTGTPAIFINGRMLSGGTPVEVLKQIVDFQAAQAAGK